MLFPKTMNGIFLRGRFTRRARGVVASAWAIVCLAAGICAEAQTPAGGEITSNTVWSGAILVYSNVTVRSGATLTVQRGTVVRLTNNVGIAANGGTVNVEGTAEQPVVLDRMTSSFTRWGDLAAVGTGSALNVRHARITRGRVRASSGGSTTIEDSELSDLTSSSGIIGGSGGALFTIRRCHIHDYEDIDLINTRTVAEDSLFERADSDIFELQNSPPGSVLRRCTFRTCLNPNSDGVDMNGCRNVLIDSCRIYDVTDKGISSGSATSASDPTSFGLVVTNTLIYSTETGIGIKDRGTASLFNNTIASAVDGVRVYQKFTGEGGHVTNGANNLVWDVSTALRLDNGGTIVTTHSDTQWQLFPGEGNISADPLWRDATASDYRLGSASPCIGAGVGGSDIGVSFPVGGLPGSPELLPPQVSQTEVLLRWTAIPRASGYLLERAVGADPFSILAHLAAVTNYTDAVAGSGVYHYRLRATNFIGSSFGSEPVEAVVAGAAELVRGPYLQMGTPSSVIIRWRTDQPTDSVVTYGTTLQNLASQVTDQAVATEHEVQLSGLAAQTKYYYTVGSRNGILAGPHAEQFFITHPVPGQPKPTRIWAIGDSGTASAGDSGAYLVRDAYYAYASSNRTDVWLMLGDNAYYSGTDAEYQTALFDTYSEMLRNTMVWSTMGNHETYGPGGPGDYAYHGIFSLPRNAQAGGVVSGTENYYSFDYANIHFVCLDSEDSIYNSSERQLMLTWLEEDLGATTNEWLIAFWHSPPYTKGSHNSDDPIDSAGRLFMMRTNVVPILEAYGVDLVLSGHSHNYERSYPLRGHYDVSQTLTAAMVKDAGSGRMDDTGAYIKSPGAPEDDGIVYVVAGSSGWATVLQPDGPHPAMYTTLLNRGSMVIDVHNNVLEAKFLRETGAIDDYFTMIKGASPEPFRFKVFKLGNGTAVARWKSRAGHCYQVEETTDLSAPSWQPVSDIIKATGATTSWTNNLLINPSAFYRVVGVSQ
jgi:hypothetical protein